MTRPSAAHDQPAADPPTGRALRRDPSPLTRREVGGLVGVIWLLGLLILGLFLVGGE